jgi:hypothetical protein
MGWNPTTWSVGGYSLDDALSNPLINPGIAAASTGIEAGTGLTPTEQMMLGAAGGTAATLYGAGAAGAGAGAGAGTAAGAGAAGALIPTLGTLGSAYLGYQASGEAADTSAAGSMYAADLLDRQFQQTRQDLAPYREAATGAPIYDTEGNVVGYEGGALQELGGYGRSQVAPTQYIPGTEIPQYNVQSNIPQFDPSQFDIYKDPSYEWRKGEAMRGIDRAAAAGGKVMSGGRLEEIMKRSGEMASQEYGAARGRMLQDYGISREAEAAQYGRDLTGYNAALAREAGMYGRGVDAYGRAYGQETDYLNRLAALSNVGQTATTATGQFGAGAATQQGQQIVGAGQAQAAGTLGQTAALTGAIGDLTSLYTASQAPTYDPYSAMNYGGGAMFAPTGREPGWTL